VAKFSFKNLSKPHKWTISVLTSALLVLVFIPSEPVSAYKNTPVPILEIGKRYDLAVDFDNLPPVAINAFDNTVERQIYKVKKGDNLAKIFSRAGLSPQETYRVSKVNKYADQLLNLLPGESLGLEIDNDGQLQSLSYVYSPTETLMIEKNDDNSFSGHIESKQVDTRINYAQGEIRSSFGMPALKPTCQKVRSWALRIFLVGTLTLRLNLEPGIVFR
jgi:LysM repeat protein